MRNQDRPGQPPKRPKDEDGEPLSGAEDVESRPAGATSQEAEARPRTYGEPLSGAEDEESRLAGATSQEVVAFLDFTVLDLIFPFIISIPFFKFGALQHN